MDYAVALAWTIYHTSQKFRESLPKRAGGRNIREGGSDT